MILILASRGKMYTPLISCFFNSFIGSNVTTILDPKFEFIRPSLYVRIGETIRGKGRFNVVFTGKTFPFDIQNFVKNYIFRKHESGFLFHEGG